MARIESYQDLDVWQLAIALTEKCYRVTTTFPRDEVYGLTSQIRRAAVSTPANIAEGWGRDQTGYYHTVPTSGARFDARARDSFHHLQAACLAEGGHCFSIAE